MEGGEVLEAADGSVEHLPCPLHLRQLTSLGHLPSLRQQRISSSAVVFPLALHGDQYTHLPASNLMYPLTPP